MPYNLYRYLYSSCSQYTVSLQAHIAPATLPTYLRHWPHCTCGDVHASLATGMDVGHSISCMSSRGKKSSRLGVFSIRGENERSSHD